MPGTLSARAALLVLALACVAFAGEAAAGVVRVGARRVQKDEGLPTALELAAPNMKRLAGDVWVARIAPGLWVHTTTKRYPDGTVYPANGMLLETRRGSVLFDTGWDAAQTRALLAWARDELKKPVTRAFVTHAHEDRLGGIASLAGAGVPVFASALTRGLARRQGYAQLPRALGGLEKRARRDAGGFELFYPGAGHTRDNVVVYFARRRVLFGGCLLKSSTAPDLGNTAEAVMSEWPSTVERVRGRYRAALVVVPGHGTTSGDSVGRTLALLEKQAGVKSAN